MGGRRSDREEEQASKHKRLCLRVCVRKLTTAKVKIKVLLVLVVQEMR